AGAPTHAPAHAVRWVGFCVVPEPLPVPRHPVAHPPRPAHRPRRPTRRRGRGGGTDTGMGRPTGLVPPGYPHPFRGGLRHPPVHPVQLPPVGVLGRCDHGRPGEPADRHVHHVPPFGRATERQHGTASG